MIKKTEVKTYIERFLCPHCNVEMKTSNAILLSCPAQYQYTCPKCRYQDTDYESYPKISYEEIEN